MTTFGKIPRQVLVSAPPGQQPLMSDEQRAGIEGAWAQFKRATGNSIAPHHTKSLQMQDGTRVRMTSSWGADVLQVALPKAGPKGGGDGPSVVVDADFLVVTYNFTEVDGADLDTRTKMTTPGSMTNFVGWSRDATYAPDGVLLVQWGGDNTGFGVESVLFRVADIATKFGPSPISIAARAFWYGGRIGGNCRLTVKAYKGGSPSLVGFGFVVSGGTLAAEIEKTTNVVFNDMVATYDGDPVGTISYNPATNLLSIA